MTSSRFIVKYHEMTKYATYVYGIASYHKETGFSGVNTFQVYSSVELAAYMCDSRIRENNRHPDFKLEPIDLEPIKEGLKYHNFMKYREDYLEDITFIYAIVRLFPLDFKVTKSPP